VIRQLPDKITIGEEKLTRQNSPLVKLKAAIAASKQSVYQLSNESGVDEMSISRFRSGTRGIRLKAADKLAKVVGMTLGRVSTTEPSEAN
jgi:hypothetical protein